MLLTAVTAVSLVVPAVVAGLPAGDTVLVGSSVHEARVPAPLDLQVAAAGDRGYHHTHKTNGGDGYKHFDSFHKKDGDSYGYEKHSAYGKGDKGDDGGEYHESSSYSSDDGDAGSSGAGSHAEPKVTAYHYESSTGSQRDNSNYDPETYEGDYTELAPRKAPLPRPRLPHPDVEVTGPMSGEKYQVLYDASPGAVKKNRNRKPSRRGGDPQAAGTEEDAEYDYYGGGSGEGDDGGYSYYEGGGDYESEGGDYEGESDYY